MTHTELLPHREMPDITVGRSTPKREVVTLYDAGGPPDPTYATVLFRIRLAEGSWVNVELSFADAQRLGHALNSAGGGTLVDASGLTELDRNEIGSLLAWLARGISLPEGCREPWRRALKKVLDRIDRERSLGKEN